MLLSALSYHLLFLLKEHVILALVSSIIKNIFKICSPVNTIHFEGNATQDNQLIHCHNIPTEFLPYTDFYNKILFIIQNSNNKNPLCSTVLHIQQQRPSRNQRRSCRGDRWYDHRRAVVWGRTRLFRHGRPGRHSEPAETTTPQAN